MKAADSNWIFSLVRFGYGHEKAAWIPILDFRAHRHNARADPEDKVATLTMGFSYGMICRENINFDVAVAYIQRLVQSDEHKDIGSMSLVNAISTGVPPASLLLKGRNPSSYEIEMNR
jgi:hypothetical protein